MQEVQRTTIYIPKKQHLLLKIYAARKRISIAEVIRELITNLLGGNK